MPRWVVRTIDEDQFGVTWDPALHVLHMCDNPPCFRYNHLFLGTHVENMADRGRKGRNARTRLTEADVRAIRTAHADGATQAELAKRYNTPASNISYIVNRRTWKHVVW